MNGSDPFGLYCTDKDGKRTPCAVSAKGEDFIERHEGFISHAYNDVTQHATIGFGHKIGKDEKFGTLSRKDAVALLKQDLSDVGPLLDAVDVNLSQNQVDALGSFIFNVGSGAFSQSTLLKKLNAGDFAAVPGQLSRWIYSDGVKLNALVTRRADEAKLFSSGAYR